jgi:hypothetical protein
MNSRAWAVVGCSKVTNMCSEDARSKNTRACAVVECSNVTDLWSEVYRSIIDAHAESSDVPKLPICGQRNLGLRIVAHAQS